MKDRTSEFLKTVDSISARQNEMNPNLPLLQSYPPQTRSEFTKAAQEISQSLQLSSQKLQKLARLARNKSMFDDTPQEINALIFVIKQDISKINRQITTLSEYSKKPLVGNRVAGAVVSNKHADEHAKNVVQGLQGVLANCSKEFQGVLEVRTKNMKEQEVRRDAYSYAPQITSRSQTSSLYDQPSSIQSSNQAVNHQQPPRRQSDSQETSIQMPEDDSGFGFTQSTANAASLDQSILTSRASAITAIESTIQELGQIYQHFALILSQQRESVMRIDENVSGVESDVEGAHGELLRYYQGLQGNRGLMVKGFGAVLVFFLVYTVFFS